MQVQVWSKQKFCTDLSPDGYNWHRAGECQRWATAIWTGWGCYQRWHMSFQRALVDHRSVEMWKVGVKNQQDDWRKQRIEERLKAEILLFMGWKDLRALWSLSDLLRGRADLRQAVHEVSFFNLPNAKSQNEIVSKLLTLCIFFPSETAKKSSLWP